LAQTGMRFEILEPEALRDQAKLMAKRLLEAAGSD